MTSETLKRISETFFYFLPPYPPYELTLSHYHNKPAIWGGQEALRSKMQPCSSHSEKVFP